MADWIWVDNFSRRIKKDLLVMEVIQWLNNTFVPLGMRPVEDLELGITNDAYSCTLANTICFNLGDPSEDIPNRRRMEPVVSVNPNETLIGWELLGYDPEGYYQREPVETAHNVVTVDNPRFVNEFIRAFDAGDFQEFVKPKKDADV